MKRRRIGEIEDWKAETEREESNQEDRGILRPKKRVCKRVNCIAVCLNEWGFLLMLKRVLLCCSECLDCASGEEEEEEEEEEENEIDERKRAFIPRRWGREPTVDC